ncbi:unnamed protein product, partial [Prorocentrum cordatum]
VIGQAFRRWSTDGPVVCLSVVMMAVARRAETDRRLQSLEERQSITEDRLARVAGQVEEIARSTSLVLEDFPSVEEAWLAHGETAQYRELREAVPDAIGKDLATHLSVPWPLLALGAAVPAGGFPAETSWVRSVLEELRQQGTVKAVYSQSRLLYLERAEQERQRAWQAKGKAQGKAQSKAQGKGKGRKGKGRKGKGVGGSGVLQAGRGGQGGKGGPGAAPPAGGAPRPPPRLLPLPQQGGRRPRRPGRSRLARQRRLAAASAADA